MYKVTSLYNGKTYMLHDPESKDLRIYNDEVVTEDNAPGSLRFSISFDHPYLEYVCGQQSDIRVYDGDEEIFRGRPIDDGEDLYRERTFTCEGELAFLYDSIQPRRELHGVTPYEFFSLLVNEHNSQMTGKGMIDKTFTVGVVTVTDSNNSLYRYTNFETTYDCIKDKLIDRLGGHLCVRIENGTRYLDLLADVSLVSDQPIQLGDNLLSYARDTDYTQIATACIPLGVHLEETEIAALDAYLDIKSVNGGSNCIQIDEAVSRYGFICKVVSFPDITVPANLKTAGERWLQEGQYATLNLDLTAVDLHTLGIDVQPIRKNRQVRVVSEPHGMDRRFEVSKRTYHLTAPDTDTVSFGVTDKVRSYTASTHSSAAKIDQKFEEVSTKMSEAIAAERENISNILNMATHGYVVLDPNDGPERILIMDTNSVDTAEKIWKWDMNGLGYSSTGINGPWGTAITMNGEISADFIVVGSLMANLIKAGKISSKNGKVYFDLDNNEIVCNKMVASSGDNVIDIGAAWKGYSTEYETAVRITKKGDKTYGLYINPSSSSSGTNVIRSNNGLDIDCGVIGSGTYRKNSRLSTLSMGKGVLYIGAEGYDSSDNYMSSGINFDASSKSATMNGSLYITDTFNLSGTFIYKGSVVNPSDRRLKKNIRDISEEYIKAIGNVELKEFEYKDQAGLRFGAIAQDVVDAMEAAGIDFEESSVVQMIEDPHTKEEVYGLNYIEFMLVRLANAENKIDEQRHEIDELKERVAKLEKLIDKLL